MQVEFEEQVSRGNASGGWRVASYARLSKEDDLVGESDSILGQREIIRSWAEKRGDVTIVAEYSDDGYSGATFDRPGFAHMIADARRGLFDTIAVKDLSRFGRSYLDCGSWIERDLPRMGVRLYSITDGFDSMTRWDYNMALLLPMKNLMNEMQVITTSEKVRTSLAAKRERGECVANFAPYGYAKDPLDRHRLVIDEKAAKVVRAIFEMRLNGQTATGIAEDLNRKGVRSPAAHKQEAGLNYHTCFASKRQPAWHAKTVLRILRDETYTGTLVQGKTSRPSWRFCTGVPVPPEQWQRARDAHEPIIDQTTFEKVAALLSHAAHPAPRHDDATLRAIRLECGGCGSPMRRIATKGARGSYAYYTCSAHRRNVRVCSTHSIREEELIAQVSLLRGNAGFEPGGEPLAVQADGTLRRREVKTNRNVAEMVSK